ncbi:MAG TPA: SPOR domain-containing protein [Bacteroidales bacterium]|nr:SPOR domain-containing protein [Bacteroidales bacterium]
MLKRILFVIFLTSVLCARAGAQSYVKTTDLFKRADKESGELNIIQHPAIDTLLSRYILMSMRVYEENGYYGMNGYRIQIYSSSNRNAREESRKADAEFVNRFPDVTSRVLYSEPGYFKVRVGDFRTKAEATRLFLEISRVFPDAYIVPDIIRFPELNKN